MTLTELRALALSLPQAVEAPHFDYASFRVGGRIFATVPPEGDRVHLFVTPDAATGVPGCSPLPWGQKIVGVRAILAEVPPDALRALVEAAWAAKAPKRLENLRRGAGRG